MKNGLQPTDMLVYIISTRKLLVNPIFMRWHESCQHLQVRDFVDAAAVLDSAHRIFEIEAEIEIQPDCSSHIEQDWCAVVQLNCFALQEGAADKAENNRAN
jgi:hypothetical protein